MTFDTSLASTTPESYRGPLLIGLVPEGGLPASLAALDQAAGGQLARIYAAGDFKGRPDEVAVGYAGQPAGRIMLVGTGKPGEASRAALRRGAATGTKRARGMVTEAAIFAAAEAHGGLGLADVVQSVTEGVHQGAWSFTEYKRPPEEPKPELARMAILAAGAGADRGYAVGEAIGQGHQYARGLQMLPPNVCTPAYLAEQATEMAARHGFKLTVLDRPALEKEGMNALLAVASGSAADPRFIVLEYQGADGPPVVLVGKGVTFDTGGISIKPAPSMEEMKYDMSGAAAVLGAFEALGRLKPKLHAVALVPSAENMPDGKSYRPADVVKSHFGKTIEVVNTDAEGRLLLADALSYARRFKPACVLDAATLTGAIVICLGPVAAGVMGNDPALVQEVVAAGQRAHERVWELPLWDDFKDLIKSDIADVKNSGGRPAGSITAGWFLREFVDGFPWAHLDIAGTAYTDRDAPSMARGPTGMGVRLFTEFLLARSRA
jgi:leucyl aminopeptidase